MSDLEKNKESWGGVWALAFGVSSIMIAEFLPVGLLTPMGKDLSVSAGVAGQTVTMASTFAVITSLTIAYFTQKLDRKYVLGALLALTALSCLTAATTPSVLILFVGSALLGVAVGGFWSMATAIAIRLVRSENVSKALSIVFGAASFSTMLSAPLGSFLGEFIGWRDVYLLNMAFAFVAFVWLIFAMPNLAPTTFVKFRTILDVLKRPSIRPGMIAIGFTFCGRFAFITYFRPYLETEVGLSGTSLSVMFLAFDLAYFVGTLLAGHFAVKHMKLALSSMPMVLALSALGLIVSTFSVTLSGFLILLLGLAFSQLPISWSAWGAKMVPDKTETVGGLYVASVQVSAAFGALTGGMVFDRVGSNGVLIMCATAWFASATMVLLFVKTKLNFKNKNKVLTLSEN